MHLDHLAGVILDDIDAGNVVGVAKTNLAADSETEEFLRWVLHEIGLLDPELTTEGNLSLSGALILGVVDGIELFGFTLGVIVDDHLQGPEHTHAPLGAAVQLIAEAVLQEGDLLGVVAPGHADPFAEGADRGGSVTPPPQSADRRQARVVPALDLPPLDQLEQLALAHDGIGQVQAGEFDLLRVALDSHLIDEPVIERTAHLEFKTAEGVGNLLNRIREPVGKVVHRVAAPLIARAVVMGM